MHSHTCRHKHTYEHACTHLHMSMYIHACTHTCHAHKLTYTGTRADSWMCTLVHIHTQEHPHTGTHIYTHICNILKLISLTIQIHGAQYLFSWRRSSGEDDKGIGKQQPQPLHSIAATQGTRAIYERSSARLFIASIWTASWVILGKVSALVGRSPHHTGTFSKSGKPAHVPSLSPSCRGSRNRDRDWP